jgi:hypothetical protein
LIDCGQNIVVGFGVVVAFFNLLCGEVGESELLLLVVKGKR